MFQKNYCHKKDFSKQLRGCSDFCHKFFVMCNITNNEHSQFCSGDGNVDLMLVNEKSKSLVHPERVIAAVSVDMKRPHGGNENELSFATW